MKDNREPNIELDQLTILVMRNKIIGALEYSNHLINIEREGVLQYFVKKYSYFEVLKNFPTVNLKYRNNEVTENTILISAITYRFNNIAKFLVAKCDVSVDQQCSRGIPPLFHALSSNNYDMFLFLLKHNANISACAIYNNRKFTLIKSCTNKAPKLVVEIITRMQLQEQSAEIADYINYIACSKSINKKNVDIIMKDIFNIYHSPEYFCKFGDTSLKQMYTWSLEFRNTFTENTIALCEQYHARFTQNTLEKALELKAGTQFTDGIKKSGRFLDQLGIDSAPSYIVRFHLFLEKDFDTNPTRNIDTHIQTGAQAHAL